MTQLHPEFIENMRALLGDELGYFLRALDGEYSAALRVNPLRAHSDEAAKEFIADPVPWAENGYYIRESTRPGAGLSHFAGAFYIQEASAMLPAAILNAQPGEKVLDLCAAPGGKSSQAAAGLMGEGLLVSNEPDTKRAKMLAGNLERLGIGNAVVVNEYPPKLAEKWPCFFDAIIVDAPCSGEGMFRREPESRLQWNPASPEGCAKRQAGILDCAAEMLRPGGRMVYSTCTYNSEENEQTVTAFLERHPEFTAKEFTVGGLSTSEGGMLKIYPHRADGDGQFAALLVKSEYAPFVSMPAKAPQKKPKGKKTDPAQDAYAMFRDMFKDADIGSATPVIWGDSLVTVPYDAPPTDGIKVISPGLELCRILGKRIEPAHHAAMALKGLPCAELTDEQALAFCRGEAVECAGSGWLTAAWHGMPLGWGKASGGMLKNHLPKGLRRSMESK